MTPSTSACGTVASTNFWRRSSLEMRLMPQRMPCTLLGLSASGGPNMARHFHHQRFTASCTMAFCSAVPCIMVISDSKPWRWWKLSSLQMRIMARA
ncbi:hypothetical protein D9M69_629490 [compost metagenome]